MKVMGDRKGPTKAAAFLCKKFLGFAEETDRMIYNLYHCNSEAPNQLNEERYLLLRGWETAVGLPHPWAPQKTSGDGFMRRQEKAPMSWHPLSCDWTRRPVGRDMSSS